MQTLKSVLIVTLFVALSLAAPSAHGQDEGEEYYFTYDDANNLLSRTVVRDGAATGQAMPLDGSGRNRPSSVGGVPLEWDANGNLKRKGDLYLAYDYRNRLTEVRDAQGTVLATYVFDAFNRRVEQRIGGDVIATAWDGLRPIETYLNGTLQTRRTYGPGLDEIVSVEHDLDGDGVLEQRYTPIYDSSGNLAVVTDTNGKPIERYAYSPYGGRRIYVDLTPPRVEQVRVVQGEIWLEVSDMVSREALTTALESGAIRLEAAPENLSLSLDTLVLHAKRHRLELQLSSPPPAGTTVTLHVEPAAILDSFHNPLAEELVLPFTWPSEDAVILDTGPPEVYEVAYRNAILEVELTEEIDLSTATPSIQVAGYGTSWTKSADGYRLTAGAPVPDGTHDLYITESLSDLSGTTLADQFYFQLHVYPSTPAWVAYRKDDERLAPESTIANEFGFHGLPEDPVTGFLYTRNRFYDPDLGRFITPDPLGYVDGPNSYAYAGNDPVNFADPLGLCKGKPGDPEECVRWWPYFPPGVATQAQRNLEAGARNPEVGRLTRAIYGAEATILGLVVSAEEDARHVLNLPHHLYDRYRREQAVQQRVQELQFELGCTFCVGDDLGQIYDVLRSEGLVDHEVMGPGIAELPIGPGRFKPRAVRATSNALRKLDDIPWGIYCRSGCEDVAQRIQRTIGGEIHRIEPGLPGARFLGPRGGRWTDWQYHEVVVKDSRVYDALTGPEGVPIGEYKALWEYADDIDFGF